MEVAVIGGGAAGFFAAISVKQHRPSAKVTILEKSDKVLAKVKVSGGGRCNVTHSCFSIAQLVKNYPRGSRQLKKAFHQFYTQDTVDWFESRGVKLKTEPDGRMFPVTDSSQTIIDCLLKEIKKLDIEIRKQSTVNNISSINNALELTINNKSQVFDKVIVATGGSPKIKGLEWLQNMGHKIEAPVPSLFTFKITNSGITELMGLSVPNAQVRIQGSKLASSGPLLITHWGMSGPAILKLSAFGAREFYDKSYQFKFQVNWTGISEIELRELLESYIQKHPKKQLQNCPLDIPNRLWMFLLSRAEINSKTSWSDLGKKSFNKLVNSLLNSIYETNGKTTFKEEFVTCGGISWNDINVQTMQSKVVPNLYFAGEIMDVDGVTGGFNFQAAWTTGFIAGKLKN